MRQISALRQFWRRWFTAHPFLIAAFPVLSVYASNRNELHVDAIGLPLLFVLGAAAALQFILIPVRRERSVRAVLGSGFILAIFAYDPLSRLLGSLARWIPELARTEWWPWAAAGAGIPLIAGLLWMRRRERSGHPLPARARFWLVAILLTLLGAGATLLGVAVGVINPLTWLRPGVLVLVWAILTSALLLRLSRLPPLPSGFVAFLNRFALVLVLLPSAQILWHEASLLSARLERAEADAVSDSGGPSDRKPPDILHIVLDAYPRADVLQRVYGLDISGFLDSLRDLGFVVADSSIANYPLTEYSFASLFNYEYLHNFESKFGLRGDLYPEMVMQQNHSRLIAQLEEWGYTTYAFKTGFAVSDHLEVNMRLMGTGQPPPRFRKTLLELTPVRALRVATRGLADEGAEIPSFRKHRERILFTLEKLPELAAEPGPKFILAHIVCPHVPYVLDRRGDPIRHHPSTLKEFLHHDLEKHRENALTYYPDQVRGISRLLLDCLEETLPRLKRPAIVLIQGDHGSTQQFERNHPENTDHHERFSVINAVRFPGDPPDAFTDDLSLVNTYRVILNEYFNEDLPLLEDRAWFPIRDGDVIEYVDVTNEARSLAPETDG